MILYEGPLVYKKMDREAYRGFKVWQGIRRRSKVYGLQMPTFSSREFIGWWLGEMKTFTGTRPSVGRLDHSKPYTWDNFRIQELRENIVEAFTRKQTVEKTRARLKKRCFGYDPQSGEILFSFLSAGDAAAFVGKRKHYISNIRSRAYTRKKLPFLVEYY
jgi:hypothetical protein